MLWHHFLETLLILLPRTPLPMTLTFYKLPSQRLYLSFIFQLATQYSPKTKALSPCFVIRSFLCIFSFPFASILSSLSTHIPPFFMRIHLPTSPVFCFYHHLFFLQHKKLSSQTEKSLCLGQVERLGNLANYWWLTSSPFVLVTLKSPSKQHSTFIEQQSSWFRLVLCNPRRQGRSRRVSEKHHGTESGKQGLLLTRLRS